MAMYNPGFPVGYQPYQMPFYGQAPYQQQTQPQQAQQPMTPPTIRAEIVQVDNEQVAANYPVAVGTPQMMMTKDDKYIYVKTAYANGQSQLDIYEKRPPKPKEAPVDMSAYVTRDELEKRLSGITEARRRASKHEEDDGDVSV